MCAIQEEAPSSVIIFLSDQWPPLAQNETGPITIAYSHASTECCDLLQSTRLTNEVKICSLSAIIVLAMPIISIIICYHTLAAQRTTNHNACYFNINNSISNRFLLFILEIITEMQGKHASSRKFWSNKK